MQELTAGLLTWYAQCRYDAIRTGEPAEVLVLSKSRSFESFKVHDLRFVLKSYAFVTFTFLPCT